ncbi:alpha/beta hydrolase [Lentilactobacillus sp. Marseille-Q4993]|uniref:alpha/beta hydrolase n=1 Tax=Lentilactobacillus sp. Marseille-Q4993 TaxID=3039492 RepID=UPI0024BC0575|nr:alpha/beta hydrolase [Lentilactobacillus sp. Marseille-Q4993]
MFKATKRFDLSKLYFPIGIIILVLGALFLWQDHPKNPDTVKAGYVSSSTPTVFVHGWTSSWRSERPWVDSAELAGIARKRMMIRVKPSGKLVIKGTVKKWMKNPIIMVQFDNNRAGEFQYTKWLTKVCKLLKSKYHVDKLNFVGHSMGAYAVIYYNMLNGKSSKIPKTEKVCAVAGPYDGIIDDHKPNQPLTGPLAKLWDDAPNKNRITISGKPKIVHPEYQILSLLKKNFPRNIRVLNIYGNLGNGSNSDGVVSTTSALSLGYLLRDHVTYYQTFEVFGNRAQHSELHNNNIVVNREMNNFLWAKNYIPSNAADTANIQN